MIMKADLLLYGLSGVKCTGGVGRARLRHVRRGGVSASLRHDALFVLLLAGGTALRSLAMAGYRPALWFNDAFDYVRIGLSPFSHPLRPQGYGLFLWILKPMHSFALVIALQHLMVLCLAIAAYRIMVHSFDVGRSWAAVATAPVLLDPFQVQLEHMPLSDTLFTVLVFSAMMLLVRADSSLWRPAAAGAFLGMATVTRTVGLPLVILAVLYLLVCDRAWRPRRALAAAPAVLATLAAFALPVGACMVWFHSSHGRFALAGSDGVFLWGRTAAFADCADHAPPRNLASMCPRKPPGQRKASSTQIWEAGSPTGWRHGHAFSAETNDRAMEFALWAMVTQPGDYAKTVSYDFFVRTFSWKREGYPHPWTESFYHFPSELQQPISDVPVIGGGTAASVTREYEEGPAETQIDETYAAPLRWYQRHVRLPGTVLGLVVVAGAAGLLRRRPGGLSPQAALLWGTGVALLLIPPLTTDFDYRYLLPATPFLAMAAVMAWRPPAEGSSFLVLTLDPRRVP